MEEGSYLVALWSPMKYELSFSRKKTAILKKSVFT